jgi:glucokinase
MAALSEENRMAAYALVGDIGGTNSRFGLVQPGSTTVSNIEALKNDEFDSLEDAARAYLDARDLDSLAAAAVAIAGPVSGTTHTLTNRDWTFTDESLRGSVNTKHLRVLNDFEALAMSLPYLAPSDLVQVGGSAPRERTLKIVLGPGTGLGMASLAPTPDGGWMALPGELGHITLPVGTREEFDLREAMSTPGQMFESEFAVTGGGLLLIYRTLSRLAGSEAKHGTPEEVLRAALEGKDPVATKTLHHFIVWLGRLAGDAAMMMQAYGGIYLAGGIVPSIIDELRRGPFREAFNDKGRLTYMMEPIPIYVIAAPYPALIGCAAAIAHHR